MSIQYLVDYENVHETGLSGMNALTAEDSVFIFHTSTKDRICLSRLDDVQAWVRVILVPPGKQSLDMHLGSFLGYLIGKEDADTRFVIVSHDTDYRNIVDFWNKAYQRKDKVQCAHGFGFPLTGTGPGAYVSIQADDSLPHSVIRDYIILMFRKYGVKHLSGLPGMYVSELCSLLNALPEYLQDRKRLGKKPLQYLIEECSDIIQIWNYSGQDWAFLRSAPLTVSGAPALNEAPEDTEPGEPAADSETRNICSGEGDPFHPILNEDLPDSDVPNPLELGDLTFNDGLDWDTESSEETALMANTEQEESPIMADAEPLIASSSSEPEDHSARETETKTGTDLRTAAKAYIRTVDQAERNSDGHIRASALRDMLMTVPEFRSGLKESGMKPIPFMQQVLADSVGIYRIKGIFWAAETSEEEPLKNADTSDAPKKLEAITERKEKFHELAFSNIRKQLTDAGVDRNIADEIAGICVRSESEGEQRKAIHLLLRQRFGGKAGAKYYRQVVKYLSF